MMECGENVLNKKWFKHFHPVLAVASGQDLKDELTLGGELTLNLWRCIHHMLSQKEKIIYCGWLDRKSFAGMLVKLTGITLAL